MAVFQRAGIKLQGRYLLSFSSSSQKVRINCYCHSSLCLLFREGQTYCTSVVYLGLGLSLFPAVKEKKSTGTWGMYMCVCIFLFFPLLHCQNPCNCCRTTGLVCGLRLLLPHSRAQFTPPTQLSLLLPHGSHLVPKFGPVRELPFSNSALLKFYLSLQPRAQVCSRTSSVPAPNEHFQSSAAHTSSAIFLFHSLTEHHNFFINFPHFITSHVSSLNLWTLQFNNSSQRVPPAQTIPLSSCCISCLGISCPSPYLPSVFPILTSSST